MRSSSNGIDGSRAGREAVADLRRLHGGLLAGRPRTDHHDVEIGGHGSRGVSATSAARLRRATSRGDARLPPASISGRSTRGAAATGHGTRAGGRHTGCTPAPEVQTMPMFRKRRARPGAVTAETPRAVRARPPGLAERLAQIAAEAAPEEALEPALRALLEASGAHAGALCLYD